MMYFRKILVAMVALVILLSCSMGEVDDWKSFSSDRDKPIDIEANSFSAEKDGWVVASGGVTIRQGSTQVTAERISINQTTGDILAEGDVVLIRENQIATRTERLAYNFKTGRGLTPDVNLRVGPLRVLAKEAVREANDTFTLNETMVTTCTNEIGRLHYHMRGRTATAKPGEYVSLAGASPYFMGVPFFYFPYWRRELNEHYGWRFEPGYDSDLGAYLLSTYKFKIMDLGGEGNNRLDSHSHFDYRTERGGAVGQDLVWYWGPEDRRHEGLVSAYYIDDDKPMDGDWDRDPRRDIVESSRYRLTFRHDSNFTSRDYLTLRSSYLSDSYLLEDFYENEYRDLIQPESYLAYSHSEDGYGYGLNVYQRANKFYTSVNRLPEAWFDVRRTDIAGSRFFYESYTAGGGIEKEFADYGNPEIEAPESYDTLRFDTKHAVYMPNKLFGFLNLIPRASYRATYYGDTIDGEQQEKGSTNEIDWVATPDDGSALRNLFELGLESSFKAYGIYADQAGRFRHIVEPYINYTFVPKPNLRPHDLYQFDSVDSLDKGHNVRFGTRHQIQRNIDNRVQVLLDADVYGVYDIEDVYGEAGLRHIGLKSRFRPTEGVRFQVNGLYNVDNSEVEKVDVWATLWNNDLWEATGEFFYRVDDSSLFAGSLTFAPSRQWEFNVYSRYEAETSRLEEQAGYVQYNLDCISFRLRGSFQPSLTRPDDTRREAKYKVGLYAWIRAFSPPPKKRLDAVREL